MGTLEILFIIIIYFQATRHLFIAAEKKIPKIRIETRQAENLTGKRIIVAIDSWPRTSRYPLVNYFAPV